MRVEKKATETISGNLVFDGVEWSIRNRDCLYFEKKGGGGIGENVFFVFFALLFCSAWSEIFSVDIERDFEEKASLAGNGTGLTGI